MPCMEMVMRNKLRIHSVLLPYIHILWVTKSSSSLIHPRVTPVDIYFYFRLALMLLFFYDCISRYDCISFSYFFIPENAIFTSLPSFFNLLLSQLHFTVELLTKLRKCLSFASPVSRFFFELPSCLVYIASIRAKLLSVPFISFKFIKIFYRKIIWL